MFRINFPFLRNNNIIYFDNAATTQKPQVVIDAITNFYTNQYATVHRGIYAASENVTNLYESARNTIAKFIDANLSEIIFTSGTTSGINFICDSWANKNLNAGDEIIITEMEHHSNILCWQRLAQINNLVLKYVPVLSDGTLDYQEYYNLLTPKTKLVSFVSTSNALGTKNNTRLIIDAAKQVGSKILLDVAQSVAHEKTSVKDLGVDFLVFSGHKLFGPTGIGVLYISQNIQNEVEPYQLGGGMVYEVDYCSFKSLKAPHKYEAGTPPIAQAIGLEAAINFINQQVNFVELNKYESSLCKQLITALEKISHIKILGPIDQLKQNGHIVSFVSSKFHAHDIAAYLDAHNIFVRAGNHCCQLLFKKMAIDGSIRVSFTLYNSPQEVEQLVSILTKI